MTRGFFSIGIWHGKAEVNVGSLRAAILCRLGFFSALTLQSAIFLLVAVNLNCELCCI